MHFLDISGGNLRHFLCISLFFDKFNRKLVCLPEFSCVLTELDDGHARLALAESAQTEAFDALIAL